MKDNNLLIVICLFILVITAVLYQNSSTPVIPQIPIMPNNTSSIEPFFIGAPIKILRYHVLDGGIEITWETPDGTDFDYLILLREEGSSDNFKLYFQDRKYSEQLSSGDDKYTYNSTETTYTLENLMNGQPYVISISQIAPGGVLTPHSREIHFTPSPDTMICTAQGTVGVIKPDEKSCVKDVYETSAYEKIAELRGLPDKHTEEREREFLEVISDCKRVVNEKDFEDDLDKIFTADGKIRNIKDDLGYPEHLILPIEKGPDSLQELVSRQLHLGVMNLNIHNTPEMNKPQ